MLKNSNTFLQGIYDLAVPPTRGCVIVNKLIITAEQQRHGIINVIFSDEKNNEFSIYKGYADFHETSESLELGWKGWKGATLRIIIENNFEVNVSADVETSMECSSYNDWLNFSSEKEYRVYGQEDVAVPLKRCQKDGQDGWKWGDAGKCYLGPKGKQKAIDQGIAIGEFAEDEDADDNKSRGGEKHMALEKIKQIEAKVTPKEDFVEGTFQTWVFDDVVGINEIIGRLKADPGGSWVTYAWRFDAEKSWTIEKAKKWLNDRNISFLTDSLNEAVQVQFKKAKKDVKFAELEMEIFAVGEWNGDQYSEEDLEAIVASFNELGATEVKPYLKLGHNEEQELAKSSGFFKDGMPAMGWINSLKKVGNKLFAHFVDVPRVIAELVEKGAYKRVSSEIYINYDDVAGRIHDFVLKAVALLGANTPAVTTLQDVVALYINDDAHMAKTYEMELNTKKEEEVQKMSTEKEVIKTDGAPEKDFTEKLDAQKTQLETKFAEEKAELQKLFDAEKEKVKEETLAEFKKQKEQVEALLEVFAGEEDILSVAKELKEKRKEYTEKSVNYAKVIEEQKIAEVKGYVLSLVAKNKLLPVQRDYAEKILYELYDNHKELVFSKSEQYGIEQKMGLIEAVKAFMEMNPDFGFLKEFSSIDPVKRYRSNEEEFDALVEKYQKDHPTVDFGKAQVEVQKMRPDLFEDKRED